ncbi:MAG TPA: efflux RND transporter periplasmic adaptor subunit [Gammaproteobacteria bacterium]|nr:efflux RND transporter periplasmic adaptor subunit [Gammaproteobacteria bacterium]
MATSVPETSEPGTRKHTRRVLVAAAVVVLLVAGVVLHFLTREPASLVLTGVVTTDEVRVSAMTQGHLRDLMAGPGDTVKKGDLLARIEPEDAQADVAYYQHTEHASAAAVEESAAQLELLEMQTREQIRQAEANLDVSRAQAAAGDANLEQARLELERQRGMRERALNSQAALDQARTAYDAARAAAQSGHKQVDAAEAALALAKANAEQIAVRRASLETSRRQLAAAGAQTERARVRLGYTEVTAPIDGIVDVRAALAGEVVNPGATIVTLIDPDDLWIRADVEETYVEKIRIGDKVQVRTPSGRVRECAVFFRGVDAEYATQRDVSRAKRDIKTFEVRVRCDNSDRRLAVGMTAYVTVPLA